MLEYVGQVPKFSWVTSYKMWNKYWEHYKISAQAEDLLVFDESFESQIQELLKNSSDLEISISDDLVLKITGDRSQIMRVVDLWLIACCEGSSYSSIDEDAFRDLIDISFGGDDLHGEPVEFLILVEQDYN